MSPEMEIVKTLMLKYALLYRERYKAEWVPTGDNIKEALDMIKPPMPGFAGLKIDDLLKRLEIFFLCKEDWVVMTKHNFHVFCSHKHRWLPTQKKTPLILPLKSKMEKVWQCPECGNELLTPGEICQKCFPTCIDCGFQHYPNETCEAFKQRDEAIKKLFNRKPSRTGEVTTIMGEKVFLKPSQKK